jgi:basic amino acid/polyamine antiporter, APA family
MYKLKRTLNLFDMIMINMGAIIGAGIFVVIGLSVSHAGPSVLVSIILASIISLFTGLSFSAIAIHIAKEGGVYEFAKDALNPFAGFMSGWSWIIGNIIAMSAMLISLGGYLNSFLGTNFPIVYFAIPALLLFMSINILGIKNSAKTIKWLVFINITALIIFVVVGAFFFKSSNFSTFAPNGFTGTLTGTAIIFFAFTGFSRVTTVADEVKEPKKNIPKAIIISIIISTVLYLLVATVALGILNYKLLASSPSPLAAAISVLHSRILDAIIAIGGIAATAGVAFTGILGVSRVFFAMGRDNELPKGLSIIDRFSTPINAILLTSLVVIIAIILIPFATTIELSNAGILTAYAIINISALSMVLRHRRNPKKPKHYLSDNKYFPIIPILGFVSVVVLLSYFSISTLYIIVAILAVGLLYYIFRNARRIVITKGREIPPYSAVREFGVSREGTSRKTQS